MTVRHHSEKGPAQSAAALRMVARTVPLRGKRMVLGSAGGAIQQAL